MDHQQIKEKYGEITKILNIDFVELQFYMSVQTEKHPIVKFRTNGNIYRYDPNSTTWVGQIGGFYYADKPELKFMDENFELPSSTESYDLSYIQNLARESLINKYGKIQKITIDAYWKYSLRLSIYVEKNCKRFLLDIFPFL